MSVELNQNLFAKSIQKPMGTNFQTLGKQTHFIPGKFKYFLRKQTVTGIKKINLFQFIENTVSVREVPIEKKLIDNREIITSF